MRPCNGCFRTRFTEYCRGENLQGLPATTNIDFSGCCVTITIPNVQSKLCQSQKGDIMTVPNMFQVQGDGLKLQLAEWPGDKAHILCIHGLTANCRSFDAVAAGLSPPHRILAVDLRGRGLPTNLTAATLGSTTVGIWPGSQPV